MFYDINLIKFLILSLIACLIILYLFLPRIEKEEHFGDQKNYLGQTQYQEHEEHEEHEENYQSFNCQNNLIISSKNKVLIISCYGYGNMGDNMYAEIFSKYLSDCEIVKISDHSIFVNSDKQFVSKPPGNNYQFDFLIIGGGGLLIADKLKISKNMPYYINDAKQRNKPLFIISCGIQGSVSEISFKNNFSLWKDTLDYAKLITVRSAKDKELLSLVTDVAKIHYFRDLGYMFPHTMGHYKNINKTKTVTLIIAGPVHDNNKIIKKYIKKSGKDVVIVNMGSLLDDDNNRRMIKMDFSGSNVFKYYGAGSSPEFTNHDSFTTSQKEMEDILKINPDLKKINPSDLTLAKLLDIIINSEIVYTGRYHGLVFARSLGIPYDTLDMGTNKILWEAPMTTVEDVVLNSYNNIKLLRKNMKLYDNSIIDIMNLKNSISILS